MMENLEGYAHWWVVAQNVKLVWGQRATNVNSEELSVTGLTAWMVLTVAKQPSYGKTVKLGM